MSDVIVQDHGSICVLLAVTAAAQDWVDEHLPEDRKTWGQNGTVVEPRYLGAIVDGMAADGLVVAT